MKINTEKYWFNICIVGLSYGYNVFVFFKYDLQHLIVSSFFTSLCLTCIYYFGFLLYKISKLHSLLYLFVAISLIIVMVIGVNKNDYYDYIGLAIVTEVFNPARSNMKANTRRIDCNIVVDNKKRTLSFITFDLNRNIVIGDTVRVKFRLYKSGEVKCYNSQNMDVLFSITNTDRLLYSRPVLYRNGREIGNKYFYYAKLFPDRVFKNFGYEILYKSVPINVSQSDSIVILQIKDIQGNDKQLKYKLSDLSNIPDTFLVFKNINDSISAHYTVCAPEINTPKNWAKISDYGYLFGYDEVYSKQEIESKCPRIKDYVEQYKKRITPPTN